MTTGTRNAYIPEWYTDVKYLNNLGGVLAKTTNAYVSGGFSARVVGRNDPDAKVRIYCITAFRGGPVHNTSDRERNWNLPLVFPTYREMTKEIAVMRLLNPCPYLMRIRDIYTSPDGADLYMAVDYRDRILSQLLRHPAEFPRTFSVSETKCIAAQLLVALFYLADANISVETITPNDIAIDVLGCSVTITRVQELFVLGLTSPSVRGAMTTTPPDPDRVPDIPYAAPEILMECTKKTPASDVYSVGCIIMELLLGRPFLHGKDTPNQLRFITEFGSGFPDEKSLERLEVFKPSPRAKSFLVGRLRPHLAAGLAEKGRLLSSLPSSDMYDIALPPPPSTPDVLAMPDPRRKKAALEYELGRDFFRRALAFVPSDRATPMELLSHPWITSDIRAAAIAATAVTAESAGTASINETLANLGSASTESEVLRILGAADIIDSPTHAALEGGPAVRDDSAPSQYHVSAVFRRPDLFDTPITPQRLPPPAINTTGGEAEASAGASTSGGNTAQE